MARGWLCLLFFFASLARSEAKATLHTVFTTECGEYFGWQSMGMIYSHRKAKQAGPLTRIMSCTPEEWNKLSDEAKNVVKTHVAPSYTRHPRTGDVYSAYNKPVAVIDWLARNNVKEDYVLIIDADMIMRKPFSPEDDGARPGRAVSAFFSYMKGVDNKLALKHVPEIHPRNDTLAGPKGRRGDQVGGFTMMSTDDLRRVAPLWLKYTEDVRADPDAWELSGDAYSVHPGDKPWISEMYGYSFACAKADVWHVCHRSAMLYPAYDVLESPKVLHYGLLYTVPGTKYKFDKHWHYQFDPFSCPPWNFNKTLSDSRGTPGGLFPHPPRPTSFKTRGAELLRDLLSVEVPITLNVAFCEHHRKKCKPSAELDFECNQADKWMSELERLTVVAEAAMPDPCQDNDKRCAEWARSGECEANTGFMMSTCALSCKACTLRKGAAAAAAATTKTPAAKTQAAAVTTTTKTTTTTRVAATHAKPIVTSPAPVKLALSKPQLQPPATRFNSVLSIPDLKLRCTRFSEWRIAQVRRCMALAAGGIAYDPETDDHIEDGDVKAHVQSRLLDRLPRVHLPGRVLTKGETVDGVNRVGVVMMGSSAALLLIVLVRYARRKAGRPRAVLGVKFGGIPRQRDD